MAGGTFATYALISRFMDISLMPGHQVGDREQRKASAKRYSIMKHFLLFLMILGVSMVIGDGILTPCISGKMIISLS
jgi:KUP system potassium uptake protein